jgi:carboxyl-terminal processing protease
MVVHTVPYSQSKLEIFNELWVLVSKNYALFDQKSIDWGHIRSEFSLQIDETISFRGLYEIADSMFLKLEDPHTRVLITPSNRPSVLPITVMNINGDYFISSVNYQGANLIPGMKIEKVNGISIKEFELELFKKFPFKSLSMQRISIINDLLIGMPDSIIEITASIGFKTIVEKIHKQELMSFVPKAIQNTETIANLLAFCSGKRISTNIGYIRINSFRNKKVVRDFIKALDFCSDLPYLILDIRGNQGGLIQETIDITSNFITEERLVGYRVKDNKVKVVREPILLKPNKTIVPFKKIVVLCDEFTMSSSEYIFLKGLQLEDRVTIIGSQTTGLAHEATVYTLFDGTKIQITTFKYLTPEGIIVDEEGIVPDILVHNSEQIIIKKKDAQLEYAIKMFQNT